jgi:uncharacterized protein
LFTLPAKIGKGEQRLTTTGDIMKMFTAKEEKNLKYVLSKSADPEVALYLEELHGLFFGIAMTPESIMPSEWLPIVFEEEPQFADDQDAETCIGHLLNTYNRMINDSNKGKLAFPFNYKKINDMEYSMIEGWAYGLFLALSLRPDIWGMSEKYEEMDEEEIPDDVMDLISSCSIVTAVAMPDEMEEIWETESEQPPESPEDLEDALYNMLPQAVETLRQHGAKIRAENGNLTPSIVISQEKTGRNDLCTCGSGKKYKKCCGNN